jgi:hypothetical protein
MIFFFHFFFNYGQHVIESFILGKFNTCQPKGFFEEVHFNSVIYYCI